MLSPCFWSACIVGGNALEVLEVVDFLKGQATEPRQLEVTRRLSAELLVIGGLAVDETEALQKVDQTLKSGRGQEQFSRMVCALGGPADFVDRLAPCLQRLCSCRCHVAAAEQAQRTLLALIQIGDAPATPGPVMVQRVVARAGTP